MFTELILLLFALIILGDYLLKKRRNDMIHYMPGPKPLPVLGNVLMYRGKSQAGECCLIFVHFSRIISIKFMSVKVQM